jgi:PAS domain S-box-containing protein
VHAQSEGVLIAARRWTKKGLRILFANESFCAMSGYTGTELREHGHGFLHESKKDLNAVHRWQTKLKPGSTFSGEGRLVRKDGSLMYSSWNYCPVSDSRGKVTHIVATYRDLTERHRLQDALVNSQRLDAVGRLAGGIAHDFNNLLSVISGYCEMIGSKRSLRTQISRELTEIHLATEKAANLVGQLLAFGRRQPGHLRTIRLDELIQNNTQILSRLLKPSRRIEFSLAAHDTSVRVDPAQIQQVLLNLVLNARDALDEGGKVTVATSLCETAPDGDSRSAPKRYVTLAVEDNGVGMSEEVRSHLFEPFYTTKSPGRGTGLGLALVYGVVKQSGGFVRVASQPGRGSTFTVFLPAASRPSKTKNRSIPHLPATSGSEQVLIIEEDEVLRKMLVHALGMDGYRVTDVASAKEALARLKSPFPRFSLVIAQTSQQYTPDEELFAGAMQLTMPDAQILLVGNSDRALFAGTNPEHIATLEKPFALSALLRTVRQLLDRKRN